MTGGAIGMEAGELRGGLGLVVGINCNRIKIFDRSPDLMHFLLETDAAFRFSAERTYIVVEKILKERQQADYLQLFQQSKFVVASVAQQTAQGPSSGLALFVALLSEIINVPVRAGNIVAFSGEIVLDGRVLPVGGVTAKLYGCIKADIKYAFIPQANATEANDLDIGKEIRVFLISNVTETLALIFPTVMNEKENSNENP